MILSINQPAYLPWLGYFDRIEKSDMHVVLDHVQFEKNSFVNRNKIRNGNDWIWLTVPVETKGKFGNLEIKNIKINNNINWKNKHWKSLQQNYSKSHYFGVYADYFEDLYQKEWCFLNELCKDITQYLLKELKINTVVKYSSEFNLAGKKSDLVLEICKELKSSTYISGELGKNYIESDKFRLNKIDVNYQNYIHPEYKQLNFKNFIGNMSILDLLFNHGPRSLEIIKNNSLISEK